MVSNLSDPSAEVPIDRDINVGAAGRRLRHFVAASHGRSELGITDREANVACRNLQAGEAEHVGRKKFGIDSKSLSTHHHLPPTFLFPYLPLTKMAEDLFDGAIGIDLGTTYS